MPIPPVGEQPLVSCLFSVYVATLYSWRLFPHLQPGDVPCCDDKGPYLTN
jgi:hypothetical protein